MQSAANEAKSTARPALDLKTLTRRLIEELYKKHGTLLAVSGEFYKLTGDTVNPSQLSRWKNGANMSRDTLQSLWNLAEATLDKPIVEKLRKGVPDWLSFR